MAEATTPGAGKYIAVPPVAWDSRSARRVARTCASGSPTPPSSCTTTSALRLARGAIASTTASSEADQEEIPTRSLLAVVDRKSTRLNSSHVAISYAVFCLKKKTSIKIAPGGQRTKLVVDNQQHNPVTHT